MESIMVEKSKNWKVKLEDTFSFVAIPRSTVGSPFWKHTGPLTKVIDLYLTHKAYGKQAVREIHVDEARKFYRVGAGQTAFLPELFKQEFGLDVSVANVMRSLHILETTYHRITSERSTKKEEGVLKITVVGYQDLQKLAKYQKAENGMSFGFVAFPRFILDMPEWYSAKLEHKVVYLTIVMLANYQQKYWKKGKVLIDRGELLMSPDKIAQACGKGITGKMVRDAITYFEGTLLANHARSRQFTKVRVLHYDADDYEAAIQRIKQMYEPDIS